MSMKILKRDNEFRKVSERNMGEVNVVNNLRKQGWEYCSKSVYKKHMGIVKKETVVEVEVDKKTTKRGKNA